MSSGHSHVILLAVQICHLNIVEFAFCDFVSFMDRRVGRKRENDHNLDVSSTRLGH